MSNTEELSAMLIRGRCDRCKTPEVLTVTENGEEYLCRCEKVKRDEYYRSMVIK